MKLIYLSIVGFMKPILLTLCFISITFSGVVTQTDWSGGSGVIGPLTSWGNCYFSSSQIETPDGLLLIEKTVLASPSENVVADNFMYFRDIHVVDLDGDNDQDIVAAGSNHVIWWENLDGSGTLWQYHYVDGQCLDSNTIHSADIDRDGDLDLVGGSTEFDKLYWWENLNSSGTDWAKHTIGNTTMWGIYSAYAKDLDSDGDVDIVCALRFRDYVVWLENVDGIGSTWSYHNIDMDFNNANTVLIADMDNDGDNDVLASGDGLAWWEYDPPSSPYWIQHNLGGPGGAYCVFAADIDSDGDMDAIASSKEGDEVSWWENIDGQGCAWEKHSVDSLYDYAASVYGVDLDDDGDMDILGASVFDMEITWWENIDGSGLTWSEHIMDSNFDGAYAVSASDIDNNGLIDVVGAAVYDKALSWWQVFEYKDQGELVSSILDMTSSVCWDSITWICEEPFGADIFFQIRTSNNPEDMGSWCDTIFEPVSLAGLIDSTHRYIQYRVGMTSEDGLKTPILDEVRIYWNYLGIEFVEGAEEFSVTVAPNPSGGVVSIYVPSVFAEETRILVYDITGKLVRDLSEIDGSVFVWNCEDSSGNEVPSGLYIIQGTAGYRSLSVSFVKL